MDSKLSTPAVLPIHLESSHLRPIAYRILSKKHGLNIKSDALKLLADYIGPVFGAEWKSKRAQTFLEDISRLWKEQDRGLFVDAPSLEEVIKEVELTNSKSLKIHSAGQQVQVDSMFSQQKQKHEHGRDIDMGETVVTDEEELQTTPITGGRTSPATSVTPPPISDTLNWKDYFQLINTSEQPKFHYNHHRRQYELDHKELSRFNTISAQSQIHLFQQRYNIMKDRLLRNENFQTNEFDSLNSITSSTTGELGNNSITQIKNLLGRNNQRFLLLGMLTKFNGDWILQDPSDKIALDLNQAEPNLGTYYVSGNMVLCDGIYSNGKFYCSSICHPPSERRAESLQACDDIDFLGIFGNLRIDRELNDKMKLLEKEVQHKLIILGGDCYLDNMKTLDAISKILSKISEDYEDRTIGTSLPICIIFNGSFSSTPLSFAEYKNCFDSLATIIEQYPVVSGNLTLIFIPGDNDHWQSSVWPKRPISKIFGTRLTRIAREVIWGSNPTRLSYLTQELVIIRDDIGSRMRRNTLPFPLLDIDEKPEELSMEISKIESQPPKISEARKLVKTLLDQGHLSPFTKDLKQINWELDHTLYLHPLPTVLVLTDPSSPNFDITYNGCKCLNAGKFIRNRMINYIEYDFSTKRSITKELRF